MSGVIAWRQLQRRPPNDKSPRSEQPRFKASRTIDPGICRRRHLLRLVRPAKNPPRVFHLGPHWDPALWHDAERLRVRERYASRAAAKTLGDLGERDPAISWGSSGQNGARIKPTTKPRGPRRRVIKRHLIPKSLTSRRLSKGRLRRHCVMALPPMTHPIVSAGSTVMMKRRECRCCRP